MLKAVCFDDKEHAHLIQFINDFRDDNNKANISSAIRFLMQKGYEYIYGKKTIQIPYNKSRINKEEIKKEVINEVISEVNTKLLSNLTTALDKLANMPSVPIVQEQYTVVSSQNKKQSVKPKNNIIPKNVETGSFLANILGNANK